MRPTQLSIVELWGIFADEVITHADALDAALAEYKHSPDQPRSS